MHYRELIVWQKAMASAKEIYRLVPLLPKEEVYGMRSQLTQAIVSVPANIAEGWARESTKEKAQFFAVAQGSLAESETLIALCEALGWFPNKETQISKGLLGEVGRMLTTLRKSYREQVESRK